MPQCVRATSLEKIEAEIQKCRELIKNTEAEIRQLEVAAAVVRRVEGVGEDQSFAGKKIRECARILLAEESPKHFRDLAKEAFARGYTSQKRGDLDVIARSFWTTLSMFKDEFERVGAGKYKLKKKLSH